MSRVLVTGGAGFVGANLVRALLTQGREVRILDDFSAGRREYVQGLPAEVVQGSITDRRILARVMRGVESVVHLAAQSGVAPSVAHPDRDFTVNVEGVFRVLDAARRSGVKRAVFASSGAVLAGVRPPLHEGLVPKPLSPYGASKLYGEAALQAFDEVFGMTGVILRFSNVYGAFCAHKNSVVAAFLRKTMRGRPLVIYGSGRQTRDFVHVDDVTRAIIKAIDASRGGIYQLGTGTETSVISLARLITRIAGIPLRLDRRPPRTGEAARNYTDIKRARSLLGWRPRIALAEGIAMTREWLADWNRRG